jgi:hypothetical protein
MSPRHPLPSSGASHQVCAAGALLNILGPELDGGLHGPKADRRSFGRLMSLVMAASAVFDGVYERRPDLE